MATAKAFLKNYRQSPRKVRLMADLIRGKKIENAMMLLEFSDKKASLPMRKLVESAVANAKDLDLTVENLTVKEIKVNEGIILYRRRTAARGRALPVRKRTSHVSVTLSDDEPVKKGKKRSTETVKEEKKEEKPAEKKETKKKVVKKEKAPAKKPAAAKK